LPSDKNSNTDFEKEYDNFNWKIYIENYPDLKEIKSKKEAWTHWISHGKKEKRVLYSLHEKEMQDYFQKHKWPDIDKKNGNFRTELSGMYDWYIDKLNTQIPPELNKAFADTINRGYSNPNLRLSYRQWINAIKGLMLPPKILKFTAV
jgi:hypothetical protein